jgi:hypothetical protein
MLRCRGRAEPGALHDPSRGVLVVTSANWRGKNSRAVFWLLRCPFACAYADPNDTLLVSWSWADLSSNCANSCIPVYACIFAPYTSLEQWWTLALPVWCAYGVYVHVPQTRNVDATSNQAVHTSRMRFAYPSAQLELTIAPGLFASRPAVRRTAQSMCSTLSPVHLTGIITPTHMANGDLRS